MSEINTLLFKPIENIPCDLFFFISQISDFTREKHIKNINSWMPLL